jgi:hypothetical protein
MIDTGARDPAVMRVNADREEPAARCLGRREGPGREYPLKRMTTPGPRIEGTRCHISPWPAEAGRRRAGLLAAPVEERPVGGAEPV